MNRSWILKQLVGVSMLSLILAIPAHADTIRSLNMTFQSGATFSGTVTFVDDYSSVLDVTGTLTGYNFGTNGYTGSGSDAINWVWANGTNFSTGAFNYSTFLMDGPGSGYTSTGGYSNWIQLAYNYSAQPTLSFTSGVSSGNTDNFVDYEDPMVSGSFGQVSQVPEPGSVLPAFLVGLAFIGILGYRLERLA